MTVKKNENGKVFGYVRISSSSQNMERQLTELENSGYVFDKIYKEIGSGSLDEERPKFIELQKMLRKGDWLIITSLDRLGRRVSNLNKLIEKLTRDGVQLISLREGFDFSTPTGKLLFNLLSSLAEYERQLILERQMLGIERAKRDGKYKGRKKIPLPEKEFFEECFWKYENSTRRNRYSITDFQEEVNQVYKNKRSSRRKGSLVLQVSKSTIARWVKLYREGNLYPTQTKYSEKKDG